MMCEIIMAILALVAVSITAFDIAGKILEGSWLLIVDNIIWTIFIVDYIVRFSFSKNKKKFFRSNIFDLIAILPFSSFLRVFRIARLLKMTKLVRLTKATKITRLFAFVAKIGNKSLSFLKTNGLIYVIYINVGIVIIGAIGIYFFEDETVITSFSDALWWSIVTTTTVGYGDITPESGAGRFIAIILMITGIGTIGMLTSTLSTYFIKKKKTDDPKEDNATDLYNDIMSLDAEQIHLIHLFIAEIKK